MLKFRTILTMALALLLIGAVQAAEAIKPF